MSSGVNHDITEKATVGDSSFSIGGDSRGAQAVDHRAHLAKLIAIYVTNKVHTASESETELIVAMQRTLAFLLAIHSPKLVPTLSFAVPIP